jgi:predicted nucleic acid-binding protein
VLQRQHFGLDAEGRSHILAQWAGASEAIDAVRPARLACVDPDDQKFLDAAFASGADWLLTRDKALLALARRAGAAGLRIGIPEAAMTYDLRKD